LSINKSFEALIEEALSKQLISFKIKGRKIIRPLVADLFG